MCIVFVFDGIFRPESWCHKQNNNKCVLYLYWTEYSGRKIRTMQSQRQKLCIVFVLNGIFRPESLYNTTINVYCICIKRNIPAGKMMPHKQNNNKCVLYLYLTEYSGRKIRTMQSQRQKLCIVFVLNGIFRPESLYNTTINVYCICIKRNIPAGKMMPHKQNNNKCVLYLYLTEYSGRKANTTQQ